MKTSKNRGTYYSPFTAVQLYTSSLPRRVRDFHPLERAHGAQTKTGGIELYAARS